MSEAAEFSFAEIEQLALNALRTAGANQTSATAVAAGIAAAERDGIGSHGLAYLSTYCEHLCGKVHGSAQPELSKPKPGLIVVVAKMGFAHPAISLGMSALIPLTRRQGIAALAIRNSDNCGVLAYHTEQLAAAGWDLPTRRPRLRLPAPCARWLGPIRSLRSPMDAAAIPFPLTKVRALLPKVRS